MIAIINNCVLRGGKKVYAAEKFDLADNSMEGTVNEAPKLEKLRKRSMEHKNKLQEEREKAIQKSNKLVEKLKKQLSLRTRPCGLPPSSIRFLSS